MEQDSFLDDSDRSFIQKVFDISIGRVRVVSVLILLVGVGLIVVGVINLVGVLVGDENGGDDVVANEENGEGDVNGDGISTQEDSEDVETQEVSTEVKEARLESATKSTEVGKWVATNYMEGDLENGNYEVQRGDTLWEIAEAVYGSGFEWGKILDANSSSVGFLPNGSQALIIPGQVLVLP